MKIRECLLGAFAIVVAVEARAGAFVNLGFDQLNWPNANPPIPGPSIDLAPGEWIRPGWSSRPQSAVGYNYTQNFSGWASIVDRDFRDTHFGLNTPAPVVGNFSLAVWPLSIPVGPGEYDPYKLTQTGEVPGDAQSLRFLYHGNDLKVFLGGDERTLQPLPDVISGDPQIPLYHYFAVDVSPYAGQTVELRFEFRSEGYDDFRGLPPRLPGEPDAQSHILDDLSFSPLPAVPEPATWALLGLGTAALWWVTRVDRTNRDHMTTPNQAAPVNARIAPQLHSGHAWRRVTEQRRSAALRVL